jgi:DNA polymerase I-like protein with 3'-5' exonuclease and polymerase domains
MFKDIVFEEFYKKLIGELQNKAYLAGIRQGVENTVQVIQEMNAAGIEVNKTTLIQYSLQRLEQEQNEMIDSLIDAVEGAIGKANESKPEVEKLETADEPTSSATIINLFPNR